MFKEGDVVKIRPDSVLYDSVGDISFKLARITDDTSNPILLRSDVEDSRLHSGPIDCNDGSRYWWSDECDLRHADMEHNQPIEDLTQSAAMLKTVLSKMTAENLLTFDEVRSLETAIAACGTLATIWSQKETANDPSRTQKAPTGAGRIHLPPSKSRRNHPRPRRRDPRARK